MSDARLKQGVDLPSVVALGLGTAVGVAIFSVLGPAAALAGPGMLASVLIAAAPMFVIALTYAFMGSALPMNGASYEWSRRFIHPAFGFFIAWLRLAGSVGALLVLSFVLVRYLSSVFDLPMKLSMFAAFFAVFVLNFFGVSIAARVQTVLMGALVLFFFAFGALGAPHVEAAAFQPFLPHGWTGALAATPLLISLFFGIEAATEVGEEVSNSRRTIPLGIAISILSAVLLYALAAFICIGVLGADRLAASEAPLLDAAKVFLGAAAESVIVTAAVVAIGKSLNALFIIFSRTLFAMGRSGALPSALGAVHSRFGTPHIALMVALAACSLALFAPMNLTTLFLALSIPTLLKYASTCMSAIIVAARHREIYDAARFKLGRGATMFWAGVGVVAAVGVALLGLSADWKPYAALSAWGVIGMTYYSLRALYSKSS